MDRLAVAATIVFIPLIFMQQLSVDGLWWYVSQLGQWIVWAVFVVDLTAKYRVFGRRLFRTRAGWIGIGIIIVTIPFLGIALVVNPEFIGTRILRLFVLLARLLNGVRRAMNPAAFPYIALAVLMVVMIGGTLLYAVELSRDGEGTMADALWWAVVTISTVGYGDITPSTNSGRAVAVVVILVGAAFMSLLTAQMAAYLSRQEHEEAEAQFVTHVQRIDERTEHLAEQVDRLVEEVRALRQRP